METKEEGKILGFRRNIFFLGLVSFFNDFSAEMVQSVMPVFLTVILGVSAEFIGFIEGAADALASVLKLFSGWFSDVVNRRKAPAIFGYMLSVGTRPFLALATNFGQVFALRLTDRIGKGFRDAPRDALIAESVERSDLGRSFGLHRTMDTLGATLGPLAAFFLLPVFGGSFRALFLFAFVIGLGALASFMFVKEKTRSALEPKKTLPKLDFSLLKKNKRFALVVLAIFVFGAGSLPILLLLLKATEAGVPTGAVPLVYLVYNLAFIFFAIPLGKLADRIGERFVVAGGFAVATVVYFSMAQTTNLAFTVALFALLGFYSAATDGVERTLAAKWLEPNILATGQGFLNMAVGFSSLIAGVIGGVLWTASGSSAALIYAGSLSLIGLFFFVRMSRARA
jgi:MFS family permease